MSFIFYKHKYFQRMLEKGEPKIIYLNLTDPFTVFTVQVLVVLTVKNKTNKLLCKLYFEYKLL